MWNKEFIAGLGIAQFKVIYQQPQSRPGKEVYG
jgi:hypothetical protein